MTTQSIGPYSKRKDSGVGSRLTSTATMPCGKPRMVKVFSSSPDAASGTVEDFRKPVCVRAFALERFPYRCKRPGERENLACDQQIGILRSNRMPIDAVMCDRHFRHQIGPSKRHAFDRRTAQCDTANDAVFCRDALPVEKSAEVFLLVLARNGSGEPH